MGKKKKDKEKEKDKAKKKKLPPENVMADIADLFAVFGDTTRIRILFALFDEEINVGSLAEKLDMTQSAVSHQLRILKQSRLVGARREGKSMYYFLADEHVRTIIGQGMEHVTE